MSRLLELMGKVFRTLMASVFFPGLLFAQTDDLSLRGQVTDPSGAVVPAVTVTLTGPDGTARETQTNREGRYVFHSLAPGNHTLRIQVTGFVGVEVPNVVIAAGQPQTMDVQLVVSAERQRVTVKGEGAEVSVSPTSTVGAVVLKGTDLNALSDNPDDLQDELLAYRLQTREWIKQKKPQNF